MTPKNPYKVPKKMQPKFDEIVALSDAVCQEHLNEEYAELCRQMAAALARKRPSPLARGRATSWGCGIVYTLGQVNFLFDPSRAPHIRADELCTAFGVAQSTAGTKAKQIRDMLDILPLDPRWCLPSLLDDNPLAWMISVNGLMVDARHMPREIQEEAHRRGLIPYALD